MQANSKYIYVSEKAPIYMLPASKAPKCSKIKVTDIREKPVDFFHSNARKSTLAPEIILITEVPVQKFSFL